MLYNHLLMFESPSQIMIVLVIVLLLFGGNRIPEMMRGMGSGLKEFKKAVNEEDTAADKADENARSTSQ